VRNGERERRRAIHIWTVEAEDLYQRVCTTVWRNLSLAEWQQFISHELPYERTCPNLPPVEGIAEALPTTSPSPFPAEARAG
jgi:hypothetical protein